MFSHHVRWYLSGIWIALALLGFVAAGGWSVQGIVFVAVVALVPPAVMLALTKAAPPTIREVLGASDNERG